MREYVRNIVRNARRSEHRPEHQRPAAVTETPSVLAHRVTTQRTDALSTNTTDLAAQSIRLARLAVSVHLAHAAQAKARGVGSEMST